MTEFAVDKYDEENDPHKPQVGDVIPDEVGGGVVARVKMVTAQQLMDIVVEHATEGTSPFDLVRDNPDRPYVKYLVWRE